MASAEKLPFIHRVIAKQRLYLYYRREGVPTVPLDGPEDSEAFRSAYRRVHESAEALLRTRRPAATSAWPTGSVGAAIELYVAGADHHRKSKNTQRQYEHYLEEFASRFGLLHMADIKTAWIDRFRDLCKDNPNFFNHVRKTMKLVTDKWMDANEGALATNFWARAKKFGGPHSDQNRPWPPEVIVMVLREATPEFRAFLVTLLLTAQRVSDVARFKASQYDAAARTLTFVCQKTHKPMVLHVPASLAAIFDGMVKHHPDRLLRTPRLKPWTEVNAQETLLSMRRRLKLGRYVLHGLRATGPTALKVLGLENRVIRELTGHDSDRNLELYLRGAGGLPMARQAQEMLAGHFEDILQRSQEGANTRRFSGVTGRAARNAGATEEQSPTGDTFPRRSTAA